MNILVNFSGKNFEDSRLRLNESALRHGIQKVASYDEAFIRSTQFYEDHPHIFKHQKGFGLWLWKPFLVLEALLDSEEGDVIIYSDAGIEVLSDLSPLIDICKKKDIVLFANGNLKNKFWTKRDCFVLTGCDEKKYWNGMQVDAAFCLFKNQPSTRQFVRDWLSFCTDERILSDHSNVMGKKNFFGFHWHRHDQAVLSLMAIRNNIELFRQPTQFGNHYKLPELRISGEFNCVSQFQTQQVSYYSINPFENSPYFQVLDHHRKKVENQIMEKLSIPQLIVKSGVRRTKKIIKLLTRQ